MYCVLIGLLAWLWIDDYTCNSKQSIANDDVGSCYWDGMRSFSFFDFHFVMTTGIALLNLLISLYLIAETRRNEVDGPVPQSENSDDNKNNKPTNRILSMKNKVVLITGANAGIGLETSRQLYHRGAIVVFACRSRERAIEAMKNVDPAAKIDQSSTTVIKSDSERMYFLPLDLTSIASVRNAAKVFDEMRLRLHVLINNAGVMRQKREETVDGLEMTMAANVRMCCNVHLLKIIFRRCSIDINIYAFLAAPWPLPSHQSSFTQASPNCSGREVSIKSNHIIIFTVHTGIQTMFKSKQCKENAIWDRFG
jgi:NAD(P)-dependent dehydrogenase (short-subunit alcohol dehydrogenase family)